MTDKIDGCGIKAADSDEEIFHSNLRTGEEGMAAVVSGWSGAGSTGFMLLSLDGERATSDFVLERLTGAY